METVISEQDVINDCFTEETNINFSIFHDYELIHSFFQKRNLPEINHKFKQFLQLIPSEYYNLKGSVLIPGSYELFLKLIPELDLIYGYAPIKFLNNLSNCGATACCQFCQPVMFQSLLDLAKKYPQTKLASLCLDTIYSFLEKAPSNLILDQPLSVDSLAEHPNLYSSIFKIFDQLFKHLPSEKIPFDDIYSTLLILLMNDSVADTVFPLIEHSSMINQSLVSFIESFNFPIFDHIINHLFLYKIQTQPSVICLISKLFENGLNFENFTNFISSNPKFRSQFFNLLLSKKTPNHEAVIKLCKVFIQKQPNLPLIQNFFNVLVFQFSDYLYNEKLAACEYFSTIPNINPFFGEEINIEEKLKTESPEDVFDQVRLSKSTFLQCLQEISDIFETNTKATVGMTRLFLYSIDMEICTEEINDIILEEEFYENLKKASLFLNEQSEVQILLNIIESKIKS